MNHFEGWNVQPLSTDQGPDHEVQPRPGTSEVMKLEQGLQMGLSHVKREKKEQIALASNSTAGMTSAASKCILSMYMYEMHLLMQG